MSESRTEVVAASQLIYDSGKREANVGLARRNVFASEYGLGDARQSVVLNVTEAYYNLQRNRELVRVQEENVRLAQTTLEAINAQVQAGAAAKTDTFQAESNLANAQINLLSAQNDVRNTGVDAEKRDGRDHIPAACPGRHHCARAEPHARHAACRKLTCRRRITTGSISSSNRKTSTRRATTCVSPRSIMAFR